MFMDKQRVPNLIVDGIFLGNYSASRNKEFLEQNNITHILTVACDIEPEFPSDFTYKIVDVDDWMEENLLQHFEACFNFIEEGQKAGGVLVHCLAGISRSPTIIVAYLMSKAKMALGDAFDLVKQKRPIIGPNPGFVEQLEEFERQLLNASRTSACKNPLVQPFIPQTVGGATGL